MIHQQLQRFTASDRYRILYMLSALLYHSTDYFLLGTQSKQQHYNNHFFLSLFTNLSLPFIKAYLITTFFILIYCLIQLFASRSASYFIEIFENIDLPIHAFLTIRFMILIRQNNDHFDRQAFWIGFLIFKTMLSFCIVLIKNIKLQLRYDGVRQKSWVKIDKSYQLILFGKLVGNMLFSILLPSQTVAYIIFMTFSTMISSIIVTNNVIYENPKIQLLVLVSQAYSWMPIVRITFNVFNNQDASAVVFEWLPFLLFLLCLVLKPKFITKLLEAKYLKALETLKRHKGSPTAIKNEEQVKLTLVVMSILTDIFFQVPENRNNIIEWSCELRTQLVYYLKKRVSQVVVASSKRSLSSKQFLLQKKGKSSQQSHVTAVKKIQMKQAFDNDLHQMNDTLEQLKSCISDKEIQLYHRRLVYELLWTVLHNVTALNNDHSHNKTKQLRLFLVYNFPDTINLMRLRSFFFYYLNRHPKQVYFERLQSQLCYKFLLSRIGNHQPLELKYQSQGHSVSSKSNAPMKTEKITDKSKKDSHNCLFQEKSFYNSKFNDILKESQISSRIFKTLHKFILNEKSFLSIFTNPSENNEMIFSYYEKRNEFRRSIKLSIDDYMDLNVKKNTLGMLFKYIQNVYLDKKVYLGYEQFQSSLTDFVINHKKSNLLKQKRQIATSTSNLRSIMGRKSSQMNSTLTCVVSGLSDVGNIYIACSKMQELMGLKILNSETQFSSPFVQKFGVRHSINDLMLPLWSQQHNHLMSSVEAYQKPINHVSQRYFMLSLRRDTLLEVKFNMYFTMKYEMDFLLVLDINYQVLEELVIQNSSNKTLFKYGESGNTLNLTLNQSQMQPIQVFEQIYFIKSQKKPQTQVLILSLIQREKSFCDVQIEEANKDYCQKVVEQRQFEEYKTTFKPFNWQMFKTLIHGLISILLFAIGIYVIVQNNQANIKQALTTLKTKQTLQNQFCLADINSIIDIGLAYSFSGKINPIDDSNDIKMKKIMFQSLQLYDQTTRSRTKIIDSKPQCNEFTEHLFNHKWINGQQLSFISSSLTHPRDYHLTLSLFADVQKLDQIWLKSPTNFSSQVNSNASDAELDKIFNFTKNLSPYEEITLAAFLNSIRQKYDYFFSDNGVIDRLTIIQIKSLQKITFHLQVVFLIVLAGSQLFICLTILDIIKIKGKLAESYGYALLFSPQFRKKARKYISKLNSLTEELRNTSENSIFDKIKPEELNLSHEIELKQLIFTDKKLKTSINSSVAGCKDNNRLEKQGINKRNFICKNLNSFILRFLIALLSLSYAYYDYNSCFQRIQSFTLALTDLAKTNVKYTKALELSMFAKGNTSDLSRQFESIIKQIQTDKRQASFTDLFIDQNVRNFILYNNFCLPDQYFDLNCSQFAINITNGLSSLKSQITQSLHLLHVNQVNSIHVDHDIRNLFMKNYQRNKILMFLTSQLSDFTFNTLSQNLSRHSKWIYVLFVILLFVSYLIEFLQVWKTVNLFHQEFLNVGSVSDLKKEIGYSFFVNQSKHKTTCPRNSNSQNESLRYMF